MSETIGKDPAALLSACEGSFYPDLSHVALTEDRWVRIATPLSQALAQTKALTARSSRTQQLRVKPLFDEALRHIYDEIVEAYYPHLKQDGEFLQKVMGVPGEHLWTEVVRHHRREAEALSRMLQ